MLIYQGQPCAYEYNMPMFDQEGNLTNRVISGSKIVLDAYAYLANLEAKINHNNPQNYLVREVYLCGSGATRNAHDSDLDLLLVAPRLDRDSANHVALMLKELFFVNRPKRVAIDPFVYEKVIFPQRKHIEITQEIQRYVDECNKKLKN